jgi:hypothetical protein
MEHGWVSYPTANFTGFWDSESRGIKEQLKGGIWEDRYGLCNSFDRNPRVCSMGAPVRRVADIQEQK